MKETKFKPSLLQSIPEDWSDGTFGDFLTTFSSGATPYRGIPSNFVGKIPWISSGELNYNRITDTNEHISQEAQRNTHLTLHKPGTFLMAITGLEAAGTRGRCAFIGTPATTNQSCLAINSTDKMTVEYLFWFYRYWSDFLAFNYSQGSKQQSFTAKIAKKLPIYAPKELQEQKAIAEALTDIDELIKGLDEWIAKKKAILEGTMQELLSGKRRLPGFSEPWEEFALGDGICELKNGYSFSSETYASKGKYSVITIANVLDGRFELGNCNKVERLPNGIQDHQQLKEGDLLISMTGNVGRVCRVTDKNCLLNQRVGLIKVSKYNDTQFIYWLLRTNIFHNFITFKAQGAAQVNIGKYDFEEFSALMPTSILEQQAIANILSDMDAEIAELEVKREKYVAIRQGMMQQLLTGKIRLI